MAWYRWLSRSAKKLLEAQPELETLVLEVVDVHLARKKAQFDGKITLDEYMEIARESYEAGEAFYELAKKLKWR